MDPNLFTELRRTWNDQSATAAANRLFEELRCDPVIAEAGPTDLGALVASIDRRSPRPAERPWRIVAVLIREMDRHELVGLALLVILTPTMLRLAERQEWGRGGPWLDQQEFASDVVATTWDVLAGLSGSTLDYPMHAVARRVLGRLRRQCENARRAMRTELLSSFEELGETERPDPVMAALAHSGALADPHPVAVLDSLAHALCEADPAVIEREAVQLVYAHRVLGYAMSELSVLLGEDYDAVRYRARCAEALLCAS